MGAKEKDWKVANVMLQGLDVWGNQARVAYLSWPPPIHGSTSTLGLSLIHCQLKFSLHLVETTKNIKMQGGVHIFV